jgi:hypothetical protein
MGKIRIMIPYVNATTFDGIARKQNWVHKLIKTKIGFSVI